VTAKRPAIGSATAQAEMEADIKADIGAARSAQRGHAASGRYAAAGRAGQTVDVFLDELSAVKRRRPHT
jgi:hypothetical protein